MPKYLQNLAARITDHAPLVKPRLPSVFEPPRADAARGLFRPNNELSDEPFNQIEAAESASDPASSSPAGVSAERHPVLELPSAGKLDRTRFPGSLSPLPMETQSRERTIGDRGPSRTPPHRETVNHEVEVSEAPRIAPKTTRALAQSSTPEKTGNEAETRRIALPSQGLPEEWSRGSFAAHEPLPVLKLAKAKTIPVTDIGLESSRRAEISASIPRASIAPTPRESARKETRRNELAEPPHEEIHVVIGKVTVQAILPAQPVQTPSAATRPKLSLEQYLKQREGRP
jgi:hypothetical protein